MVRTSEGWAHLESTRMNITPTILPKKIEDLRAARASRTLGSSVSRDGELSYL